MTNEEIKKKIEKMYGKCTILRTGNDTVLTNANNDTDSKAPLGISWIRYWMAMTGNNSSYLTCSSCGKIIYPDPVPKFMDKMFRLLDDTAEAHVAMGGHVWVEDPDDARFPGGKYIVPLCPACNIKRGERLTMRPNVKACKELGGQDNG